MNMNISEQIRMNRKKIRSSQEELAERVYVSRQTISSWENGKSYPDLQSLLLLSEIFSISLDELIKGDVEEMK
jgi:transcriptional regulator with XRE-family HTH domain